MSTHTPHLPSLLLDLLSPLRPVAPALLRSLSEQDWGRLAVMARQHRLGPLLYWQAKRRGHALPAPVLDQWRQASRQQTMHSLLLQRELALISRVLNAAGIPFVALKGAYLAHYAYPEAQLRPLRDIDILVPREHALQAWQLLLDNGLARCPDHPGDPAACLAVAKHLPLLKGRNPRVAVELHTRLLDPEHTVQLGADLSEIDGFWNRTVESTIGDAAVRYESPTDLLLHLIVHAVYDHQFNNGPLLLSDLAFLLERQPIDWPLFWELADQGQFTRGCVLALAMVEQYWGAKPVEWPAQVNPMRESVAALIGHVIPLLVQDTSGRNFLAYAGRVSTTANRREGAAAFLRKLFPSRTTLARKSQAKAGSSLVWLWYPVRWWHIMLRVGPDYLRRSLAARKSGEIAHLRQLNRWLS